MKKILLGILGMGSILSIMAGMYVLFYEPKTLIIREYELVCDKWTAGHKRIAILSDIHIGGIHVNLEQIHKIQNHLQILKPDLILYLGDYINGHKPISQRSKQFQKNIEESLSEIMHISAPLGRYAILGNHDSWYGKEELKKIITKTGTQLLENQSVYIEIDQNQNHKGLDQLSKSFNSSTLKDQTIPLIKTETSKRSALDRKKENEHPRQKKINSEYQKTKHGFWIVGVEDYDTGNPDWKQALKGIPESEFIIGITHSPDSFPEPDNSVSLGLAGHTHGGQVNLPVFGRIITSSKYKKRYAYGFKKEKNQLFYTTSGIGTSILPIRFRAPPEIVIMNITRRTQSNQSTINQNQCQIEIAIDQ